MNFNDERYLPFEFAGVISDWEIELSTEKELRQFDQSTISDVIMQMNYTARETGGRFKKAAQDHLKNYLKKQAALGKGPLTQMFNLRKEFPSEWHKFLFPAEGDQVLRLVLGNQRFPFVANGRKIVIDEISLIARCKNKAADYKVNMSFGDTSDQSNGLTTDFVMRQNEKLGGLVVGTLSQTDIASNSEKMDVSKTLSIKLKHVNAVDFASLKTEPEEEVGDMYLIMAYHLE